MTRVLTSAEQVQAEATAAERERNREAWNLPRQPRQAKDHASPDSQEPAPRDELGPSPSRATVPTLDINRVDHDATGQDLDWERFRAAYFPGSRRHDLRAITAYASYRHAHVVDGQSATESSRLRAGDGISTSATAVDASEDEGSASP